MLIAPSLKAITPKRKRGLAGVQFTYPCLRFGLREGAVWCLTLLLFVQVLDKHHFYTANLLLFNRWMLFLLVLIAGFYLLCLLKAKRL